MNSDDLLQILPIYTNELLLVDIDYNFDLLWISCRNNCIEFLKKRTNFINNKENIVNNGIKKLYETSLIQNNSNISSLLFNDFENIVYKDILLKCIINNYKKSLLFLKNKNIYQNIYINDFNEEYIVSECLRIGNYKLAKTIIKNYNLSYDKLVYYIYVKKINVKMLLWLINKIENKKDIKFINIFNYIDLKDFKKIFKITGNIIINNKYYNKCISLKKYDICKTMIENNKNIFNNIYTKNIKTITFL
jgi:hypothetical protein